MYSTNSLHIPVKAFFFCTERGTGVILEHLFELDGKQNRPVMNQSLESLPPPPFGDDQGIHFLFVQVKESEFSAPRSTPFLKTVY